MKKQIYLVISFACLLILSSCIYDDCGQTVIGYEVSELIGTHIIGVVGDFNDGEVVIEYNKADETNPDEKINVKTEWITSKSDFFQNDKVYYTYLYRLMRDNKNNIKYTKYLMRNFDEDGGAEFLKISNNTNSEIEFFITPSIPRRGFIYNGKTIYDLLFPEDDLAEPWNVADIADLYREEYNRSETIRLTTGVGDYRLVDLVEGKIEECTAYYGDIYYGIIEPGETFYGNENFWLLATPYSYYNLLESGTLKTAKDEK